MNLPEDGLDSGLDSFFDSKVVPLRPRPPRVDSDFVTTDPYTRTEPPLVSLKSGLICIAWGLLIGGTIGGFWVTSCS